MSGSSTHKPINLAKDNCSAEINYSSDEAGIVLKDDDHDSSIDAPIPSIDVVSSSIVLIDFDQLIIRWDATHLPEDVDTKSKDWTDQELRHLIKFSWAMRKIIHQIRLQLKNDEQIHILSATQPYWFIKRIMDIVAMDDTASYITINDKSKTKTEHLQDIALKYQENSTVRFIYVGHDCESRDLFKSYLSELQGIEFIDVQQYGRWHKEILDLIQRNKDWYDQFTANYSNERNFMDVLYNKHYVRGCEQFTKETSNLDTQSVFNKAKVLQNELTELQNKLDRIAPMFKKIAIKQIFNVMGQLSAAEEKLKYATEPSENYDSSHFEQLTNQIKCASDYPVSHSLQLSELRQVLNDYKKNRENYSKQSYFISLFNMSNSFGGFSKEVKFQAIDALLQIVNNHSSESDNLTPEHKKALNQGRLGKVINKYLKKSGRNLEITNRINSLLSTSDSQLGLN